MVPILFASPSNTVQWFKQFRISSSSGFLKIKTMELNNFKILLYTNFSVNTNVFTVDVYDRKPSSGHPFFSPGSGYFVYYPKRLNDFDWTKHVLSRKLNVSRRTFKRHMILPRSINERLVVVYLMSYCFRWNVCELQIKTHNPQRLNSSSSGFIT